MIMIIFSTLLDVASNDWSPQVKYISSLEWFNFTSWDGERIIYSITDLTLWYWYGKIFFATSLREVHSTQS